MLDLEMLRKRRIEKRIPLKEMASKLHVHINCYLNYEKGRRNPSVERIMEIAQILEVNWKEFYKDIKE